MKLNIALGYDFNTVEFAVRDGIPIAIDFCNPAPDADVYSVGHENFEWVVEAAANMAIERAKKQVPGQTNLTWGTFVQESAAMMSSVRAGMSEVAPEKLSEPEAPEEETFPEDPTSPPITAEEVMSKVAVKKAKANKKDKPETEAILEIREPAKKASKKKI